MITAYTMLKVDTGKEKEVFDFVKGLRGVKEATVIYGDYDILVKFEVESTIILSKYILETLRKHPGVITTTTYMAAPF